MRIIILLLVLNLNFVTFAQKIKKTVNNKTDIELLLLKGIKPQLTFYWETNDNFVKPYAIFRETIILDLNNKSCLKLDDFSLKNIQFKEGLKLTERNDVDSQRKYNYNFEIKNDSLIIDKWYLYKFIFNKKKNKIIKIESLDNKRIYIPKEYEHYRGSEEPFEIPSKN
jgi:hypothetical protein